MRVEEGTVVDQEIEKVSKAKVKSALTPSDLNYVPRL